MSPSLWAAVERTYGIKIRSADKVHDVYRIRTSDTGYCLKKYLFQEEDVRFIARVFHCLQQNGFTRGQRIYPTMDQSSYMTHAGQHYTLTNWVDGDRPAFRRGNDFKKAVRTLAKFHEAAQGFPWAEAPAGRDRYAELGPEMAEYKELLGRYGSTRHLVPLCDQVLGELSGTAAEEAMQAERQAAAFVHGDYNYPNLIKDPAGKLHLIDFENTSLNCRMKDLSHILHRNFTWNGAGMLRWIDQYHRRRALGRPDLHLLHALLTAPYHVVRNIRIGGIKNARSVIPSADKLRRYQRELLSLLS